MRYRQPLSLLLLCLFLVELRAQVHAPQKAARTTIKPGTTRINAKDNEEYVWVPPGNFIMGCSPNDECGDDEKPSHRVTITHGFWLGKTEVTVGSWKRHVMEIGGAMPEPPRFNNRGLNPGWQDEQQPMVAITWDDANAFCKWEGGRLPTEAEWEYAARAGTTGPRYGDVDEIAWHAGNSGSRPIDSDGIVRSNPRGYSDVFFRNGNGIKSVAQKAPNAWQLFDMIGNVWEWTADRYDSNYYRLGPATDPQGPASGMSRVTRGGAWFYPAMIARASTRHASEQSGSGGIVGLRCVWSGGAGPSKTPPKEATHATESEPQPAPSARSSGDETANAIVRGVDRFLQGLGGDGRANRGVGDSTKANFFGGMWVTAVQGDRVYFNDQAFDTQVGEKFPLQKLVVTLKDARGYPVEWHAVRTGEVTIIEVRRDGTRVGTYTGERINPASIKGENQTPYRIVFD